MPALLTDKPSREHPTGIPAGPDQGVIEEARRRQRSRWLRVSLAVLLLALAGAGGLIAATRGGKPPTEVPLHLPPEPSPLAAHPGSGAQFAVVHLSPNLEGGQAGWCVTIIEASGASGSCGPLPTFSHPLLYSSFGWTHGDRYVTTTEITAPRVAYFLVNGNRRLATKPLPGVPYGLRIAILHTRLHGSPDRPSFAMRSPTLVPLDALGKRIAESPDHGASWFRDWNPPATPLGGPCQLHVSGLARATPKWGQVATVIRPYPAKIIGHGFLSCVDTEYFIPGHGLRAAVLLDAANPLHATPAAIPGLAPIRQAPGLYNSAGDVQLGRMTARREGNAWLVVAGGGPNAEEARIRLLRHLRVTLPS
ncbi:MAG TPA: hypothetical protein VIJ33_05560 [Solirubrobacteraceae bacterium]